MEEFKVWLWIFWETISPANLSWVAIVVPAIVVLLLIIVYRARKPNALNAWHEVGRRVQTIGWVMIVTAVLLYGALGLPLEKLYKDDYAKRLVDRAQKIDRWDIKQQVEYLASRFIQKIGEKDLKKKMINSVVALDKSQRMNFVSAFCDSRHDKPVTVFYGALYWPTNKIEEFKKSNKAFPIDLGRAELYTPEQHRMLDALDMKSLNASLSTNQWKYLAGQYIEPLNQIELIDLTQYLCEYLGDSADDFKKEMETAVYGEGQEVTGDKLAWLFRYPDQQNVFDTLLKEYGWLNCSAWLVLYFIVGALLVVRGVAMARSKLPQDLRV